MMCLLVFIIIVFFILVFFEVGMNNVFVFIKLFKWIDLEFLNVLWSFNFDFLMVLMLMFVLIVFLLVYLYFMGYMSSDFYN